MDRFDDMRAKVSMTEENAGGSSGESSNTGTAYLGGTTVTIEPTVSLSKGDRFVGVKNADATVQMAYTGLGGAGNLAVTSEDLSVGIVNATLTADSSTLQVAFLTDDYYYEYVDVDIPSGAITDGVTISGNATINEDGTLIVIKGLNDDEGVGRRLLIIDVNKTNKSATCDYQDLGITLTNFTLAEGSETVWYSISNSRRSSAFNNIRLTKNYLICTSTVTYDYNYWYVDPETEDKTYSGSNTVTSIHKYTGSSFKTKPAYCVYTGGSSYITNRAHASACHCVASGWYNDNTLLFIHSFIATQSSSGATPQVHKFVFDEDGDSVVSHSSITGIGQAYKYYNPSYNMSKNGCYIGYRCNYESTYSYAYMYRLNPLDMTVTSLGSAPSKSTVCFTSDGDYFLCSSSIYKTSDTSTVAYSAKALSGSRHFEFTNGRYYRSGNFKCYLSPATDAEYVVSANYGDCTTDGNIYGVVNESLNAGEKGTGQMLFASGTVTTGTSDVEEVVSPPRFINHIESTGTQYIKTGVTVNQDTKIIMDVLFNDITSNEALWCSRTDGTTNTFTCFKIANQFRTDYNTTQNTISTLTIEPYKKYQVCQNSNLFYVDGVLQHESNVAEFTSPYNMLLFASHQNGETSGLNNYGKYKLYACKIYDGETLVRYFKPAIYNNQYCLYDVVESKPYYNAGTGVFMGDGEFNEMVEYDIPEIDNTPTFIEYIESSGTQYIDTGVNGTAKGTYEIKFSMLGSAITTYEQYFAGDQTATTAKIFCSANENIVKAEQGSTSWTLFNIDANAHTIKVSEDGIYADDVKITDYTPNSWGTLTYYVFNAHGQMTLQSTMKLYFLKMYSDGVLVRDFKPAIVRNQYCLYDMVESKPYFNIGTGSFTGA